MHEYEWFKKRIGTVLKATFPSKIVKEVKVLNERHAAWLAKDSQSLGYEYEDKQVIHRFDSTCISCEG